MPTFDAQELDQLFFSPLFHARNRIRFAMDDRFKPVGITHATWCALNFLRQDDGFFQKHLAKAMAIEGPGPVRLLDNLANKSLIERRSDPTGPAPTLHPWLRPRCFSTDLAGGSMTDQATSISLMRGFQQR